MVNAAFGLYAKYSAWGQTRGQILQQLADEIEADDLRELVEEKLDWPG